MITKPRTETVAAPRGCNRSGDERLAKLAPDGREGHGAAGFGTLLEEWAHHARPLAARPTGDRTGRALGHQLSTAREVHLRRSRFMPFLDLGIDGNHSDRKGEHWVYKRVSEQHVSEVHDCQQ